LGQGTTKWTITDYGTHPAKRSKTQGQSLGAVKGENCSGKKSHHGPNDGLSHGGERKKKGGKIWDSLGASNEKGFLNKGTTCLGIFSMENLGEGEGETKQ